MLRAVGRLGVFALVCLGTLGVASGQVEGVPPPAADPSTSDPDASVTEGGVVPLPSEPVPPVDPPEVVIPPAPVEQLPPPPLESAPAPHAVAAATRHRGWDLEAPVVGRVGVGAMVNYLTLHGRAPFVFATFGVDPSAEKGAWRFRLPVDLRHRQAFVTPWTETSGQGSFEIRYRPVRRFHTELSGGAIARLRPAWLDLYQPISPGNLSTTHRYSRWSRFLRLEVGGMPIRRHHLRLAYRYSYLRYWQDPNYNPLYFPTHLVPYDHTEHLVEASWHHLKGPLRVGGTVVARHRNYYFAFARDEGTGLTHASVFGSIPNPLQRLWYLRPSVDARIDASRTTRIRLEYGHEVQIDQYEGYFSYQGPNPSAGVEIDATRRLSLEAEAALQWRRYGPGSFQAGPTHPPLEDGSRRYAHRWSTRVGASYDVNAHVAVYGDVHLVVRSSNRPDYVPGVYPAMRQYSIDFDYTNFRATAGVRMTH